MDWLRQAAKPPPGVELVSADGSLFTGVIVVDRNRPVIVLAARQLPGSRATSPIWSPQPPYDPSFNPVHRSSQFGGSNASMPRFLDEEDEARRGESPPFWQR